MKTKSVFVIVMCFTLSIGTAQQYTDNIKKDRVKSNVQYNSPDLVESNSSTGLVSQSSLGEECEIYLNENFEKGKLTLKDNTVLDDRFYRFNIYSQQMEYIFNDDTAAIGNPEELKILEFDDRQFVYTEYNFDNKVNKAYMEILVDGEYKLMVLRNIKYTLKEDTGDPASEPHETYYLGEKYFTSNKNETANQIVLKKKDVINSVQIPGKNVKEYMKENKNHMRNESDLVDVISYCNAPN